MKDKWERALETERLHLHIYHIGLLSTKERFVCISGSLPLVAAVCKARPPSRTSLTLESLEGNSAKGGSREGRVRPACGLRCLSQQDRGLEV